MLQTLVVLLLFVVAHGGSSPSQKITASVRDVAVNGVEGLNIKWVAPFKFDDCVVGFKYCVGNMKNAPESFFAQKSFPTWLDGTGSVQGEYSMDEKTLAMSAGWNHEKLAVEVQGNSQDLLTAAAVSGTHKFGDHALSVKGVYDHLTKRMVGQGSLSTGETVANIRVDSETQDPILSVSHQLNNNNYVEPSISLKTGGMMYGWIRKWHGGQVSTTLHPEDKVEVCWEDEGVDGKWTTSANIPLDDSSKTSISFSRDWNY